MEDIRSQFPILNKKLPSGKPLVYFDSANSSQKPQRVIDRMNKFMTEEYSSVGRSIHELSNHATALVEKSRQAVADFINAYDKDEIVFTKSATEALRSYPIPRSASKVLPACAGFSCAFILILRLK